MVGEASVRAKEAITWKAEERAGASIERPAGAKTIDDEIELREVAQDAEESLADEGTIGGAEPRLLEQRVKDLVRESFPFLPLQQGAERGLAGVHLHLRYLRRAMHARTSAEYSPASFATGLIPGAADGVIREAHLPHRGGVEKISAVEDKRSVHPVLHFGEVLICELFPFRGENECLGVVDGIEG